MRIALEPTLAFTNQVNCISRVCLYHLCQLHSICRSLSLLAISILVHAMICTQVDLRMLFIFPFLPPTLIYFNLFSMLLPIAWAAFTNLLIFQALSGTHFIGSLFNSVYSSNSLLLCATVSLGWLRLTWDLSALWSPLYLEGPPYNLPLVVLWLFHACALLRPDPGLCWPLGLELSSTVPVPGITSPAVEMPWDFHCLLEWHYTTIWLHYIT